MMIMILESMPFVLDHNNTTGPTIGANVDQYIGDDIYCCLHKGDLSKFLNLLN